MFLVDAHCHLNGEYFPNGLDGVFARAANVGVSRMIFASSDVSTSREAAKTAALFTKEPQIYATVGVHPHEAANATFDCLRELAALAKEPRVCAIGEIGLDYFYDISPRNVQRKIFREQLRLAAELSMPVAIHVRDAKEKEKGDAFGEVIDILREERASGAAGVVHCFSGCEKEAEAALSLGFYLSFSAIITYPRNTRLREIAMNAPLDKILCETDSPYLAPQGERGKTNEPRNVRRVYETIAMLRGTSVEEFARAVKKNGEKLFNLPE